MIGVDTSGLIPLAIEEHLKRGATEALVADLLEVPETRLAVTPSVLAEFIHAVTDPKRFERPLTMAQAVNWVSQFLSLPQTILLMPESPAIPQWLERMRAYRLGRKRTLDTQLAATLTTAGIRRLLTLNPNDFRIFGAFELLVPGEYGQLAGE